MRRLLVLPLVLALLSGCSGDGKGFRTADGRLEVAAAAYPFAWLAEKVGGPDVHVTNLVKPGTEPHDIELSPSQVVLVRRAALVVYLKGFQAAVDDAVAGDKEGLDLGTVIKQIGSGTSKDPHIWLDPARMETAASAIGRRLAALDVKHARDYQLRAVGVVAGLRAVHVSMQLLLAHCARREIVTSHSAFAYLAERYGLVQHGISGLTPDAEPSPGKVAEVADFARQHGVTTIFFESLVDPKVAQTVASEIGAKTAVLDPIEGVKAGDDYLKVMLRNAQTLHVALGCR
ncbi:MAG: scbA [Frankiales bacterium]|nr:scbA [Frankiales bacterium]